MRGGLIRGIAPGREEKPPATRLVVFVERSTRVTRFAGSRSATSRDAWAGSPQIRKNGAVRPVTMVAADPSLRRIFLIRPGVACSVTYAYWRAEGMASATAVFSGTGIGGFVPLCKLILYG